MSFRAGLRHSSAVCAFLFVVAAGSHGIARAQGSALPSSGASVVKTHAYASVGPVARGSDFQVALVVDIASGFHMNSHKPLDSYLIPTSLTPQLPKGITLADTVYPGGHNEKFPFSPDKPLNVYTGSVTLRLKLTAQPSAPLGATAIPMTLRYQACNNTACLPPMKLPVSIQVHVAAAGAKGHPLHPEIFSPDSSH
jgi:DsbC/DsbD-like thiol-disulfide interchange protein